MKEDRFEELMRDAAHSYRKPPVADFDAMWSDIEDRVANGEGQATIGHAGRRSPFTLRSSLVALAATLVIGIALGRASTSLGSKPAPAATPYGAMTVASNTQSLP